TASSSAGTTHSTGRRWGSSGAHPSRWRTRSARPGRFDPATSTVVSRVSCSPARRRPLASASRWCSSRASWPPAGSTTTCANQRCCAGETGGCGRARRAAGEPPGDGPPTETGAAARHVDDQTVAMIVRRPTEADRRALASCAAPLQVRPEHHVAYLGTDPESIAAEMIEDVDDWTEAAAVAADEGADGRIAGWLMGSI